MKIRAMLLAVVAASFTLYAVSQTRVAPPYDLSHTVPVQVGKTILQGGDNIVIDAIHGSADTISAGNVYRVDGHYKLASHDEANLSISITSAVDAHNDSHVPGRIESMMVDKGEGTFSLYFRMGSNGSAHLSFYPAKGGQRFASVYFNGTDAWAKAN
jgi:hypothetical protein